MNGTIPKTLVLTAAVIALATTIGCEKQNLSDIKRTRLIAAENIQLKKDLAQCNKEIEEQKKLLEKCKGEKKRTGKMMLDMATAKLQDIKKIKTLEEENKNLKAQIEDLKKPAQSPEPNTPDQNSVK